MLSFSNMYERRLVSEVVDALQYFAARRRQRARSHKLHCRHKTRWSAGCALCVPGSTCVLSEHGSLLRLSFQLQRASCTQIWTQWVAQIGWLPLVLAASTRAGLRP